MRLLIPPLNLFNSQIMDRNAHRPPMDFAQYGASNTITREVCVIGGGAAGRYSAIRLRQLNKSVVVIERQARLGGQTTTYMDPVTGQSIDYGVTYFQNLPLVRAFFDHFKIPLSSVSFDFHLDMVDLHAETRVASSSYPPPTEAAQAKEKYLAELARYPYLKAGFDLPSPVPEDLLLPFGDFLRKHTMEAAIFELGTLVNPLGDWAAKPTLYVFKYLNLDVMEGAKTNFLRPVDRNNSAPYVAAQRELGEDVLLSSHIKRSQRGHSDGWNYIEVQSPSGQKLIRAKKIIVAAPPKPDNLAGFGLTDAETKVFSQFDNIYFYPALVRITGLPENVCYQNRGTNDPFLRPQVPSMVLLRPNEVHSLRTVHYASPRPLSEDQVKEGILQDIRRLLSITNIEDVSEPEFVVVGNHSPYHLTVSADAIANGFYDKLNGLQDTLNTYYTGAAFESQNTPQIWQVTEDLLLQQVVPSLQD